MAKKRAITVQKATDTIPHMGGFTLPISFYTSGNIAPEWEAGDRDWFLRTFWKRFGNDMLQGVIATVVAKVQTQNWQLEGPKRLVQMYHRLLRDESDFHRGYDSLISRGLQDYYTQDNGWFMERQRAGKRDKSGPALGFSHLDSQRMRATGNVEYPWYYEDVAGKFHLMHRSQVIRIVDLATPASEMWSDERGFCALSRTLSAAMILTMIVAMKREKLADLPPSALAIFNNISRKQFENSLRLKGMEDDMANNMLYRQLLPLFGIDPAHPASVQFLSLREVWEGFSDEEAMNMAAYSFAAGFRIDPREFWPVSQGTLGTGKEAEVQHQKAKGKGHGLIFTNMERALNANDSLPKNVKFRFAIQDADEEEQRAKIHSIQIGNIEGMQKAGAGLVPAEVRYLLVKKYKVIPQELLVPPVEGEEPNLIIADVYMDDVERQAKEYGGWFFGPVVTMDQDGSIYRKAAWDSARKELPEGPLFIGYKGGAGSGNWGHAGRPGIRGGSSARSNPQARVGATRQRLKLARVGREKRDQERQEAEFAAQEVRDMQKHSQERRAEATKPVEVLTDGIDDETLQYTQVVDLASEIEPGRFGGGYFIREDGKLVDITSDFGQGTNDHVGYLVALDNPEVIGLEKSQVARMVQLNDDLFVNERWDFGSLQYKKMEMEWYDELDTLWEGVFDAGNIRIRNHNIRGNTLVAIDGPNLPQNSSGLRRLQNFVLDGKILRANEYVWDDESKGGAYLAFSDNELLASNSIRDLRIASASKELQPSTKELTLQTLTKEFPCCDSHAAQEFPKLIDNLQELGYLSTEEAYASELMPADAVASIATGLKQAGKQGDDLLMAFVREFRYKLGLREYDLGEKAHKGLETINKKIAVLPRPQAMQVRKASTELFQVMDNKEGNQRVKNIPQEVWDEAEKLDLQESKPETGEKGGAGSGNWGHAGRPGIRGGSSARSNPQARVGATRQRLKLARVGREKRDQERQEAEEEVAQNNLGADPIPIVGGSLVDSYRDVASEGGFAGRAYIITDTGSLTNMDDVNATHDEIMESNPEMFGLDPGIDFIFEDTASIRKDVAQEGNVFVRVTPNMVAIEGAGINTSSGIQRLQNWILVDNKLPTKRGAEYVISDLSSGEFAIVDLDALLTARNFRDLESSAKELEESSIEES